MAEIDKKEELLKVAEEISVCVKCPLSKTRTNTVPGDGSAEAEIMLIGEAPGYHEDQKGIPFCGAAGKFLEEMLAEIGLKRSDVFIANTLKCRPPENRDPEDAEKTACRPYLDRQIKIIEPKLIVCLGKHAVSTLMPGAGSITQLHGKAVRRPSGQVYFALYHPAAALHNGSLRQTLVDDFKKIPAIIEKIKDKKSNIKNKEEETNTKQQKLI
jgi:DNA polymerase